MKVLNRLSVSFLVINAMTKNYIKNAIISCNGKLGGYISKMNGYYIYTNLEKSKYNFEIRCQGFISQTFEVDLTENNEYENTCIMQYSVDSAKFLLVNKPICLVVLKGKPLANASLKIIQDNKVVALRVSKTTEDNSNCIELNCRCNKEILYQTYAYGATSQNELFINDYNDEKKAYLTNENIQKKIKIGTLLKPMWEVTTDEKGLFVLPVSDVFATDDAVMDFTIKYGNQIKKIKSQQINKGEMKPIEF